MTPPTITWAADTGTGRWLSIQRRRTGPSLRVKKREKKVNEMKKASEVRPRIPLPTPWTSVERTCDVAPWALEPAVAAPDDETPASCTQPCIVEAAADASDEIWLDCE